MNDNGHQSTLIEGFEPRSSSIFPLMETLLSKQSCIKIPYSVAIEIPQCKQKNLHQFLAHFLFKYEFMKNKTDKRTFENVWIQLRNVWIQLSTNEYSWKCMNTVKNFEYSWKSMNTVEKAFQSEKCDIFASFFLRFDKCLDCYKGLESQKNNCDFLNAPLMNPFIKIDC